MTNKELQEKLKQFPDEFPIAILTSDWSEGEQFVMFVELDEDDVNVYEDEIYLSRI